MPDIFETETYDYELTKGDTVYLKFQFINTEDGSERNITGMACKFNVRDPITRERIAVLEKIHEDTGPSGGGIYYLNDIFKPLELSMTTTNQLVVILNIADTAQLDKGVYQFEIEFTFGTTKFTAVKGNLVVTEEITASV